MKLITSSEALRTYRKEFEPGSQCIGLVPTMGALHAGHLSLVERAIESCDHVIVSIFVNPTQFNDPNDLKNYPRNLDADLRLLKEHKIDLVFAPGIHDIYPHPDKRIFSFGKLEEVMEGKHRPGHFNGVAQVVSILFELTQPHRAFFGQKDFQQVAIVRELVKKLDMKIDIVACPTIREENGLAMSSRNNLLSNKDRQTAGKIYRVLSDAVKQNRDSSPAEVAVRGFKELDNTPGIDVEYFEIVNSQNLQPVKSWSGKGNEIACTAVKINNVRLIDNMFFD